MTARLNARVGEELARKVKYLRQRTGYSTTQVVTASLEAYYARVTQAEEPALLLKDFVGCAAGPTNLSSNYKALLAESLTSKHSPSGSQPKPRRRSQKQSARNK